MELTEVRGDMQVERPAKILVVDDDYGFRDMISFSLEKLGYAVSTAGDGVEALEMLAVKQPDLMILDVMMPGLSGYDLLERMRCDSNTSTQVIIVSAAPDVDIARLCVAAYLAKPFGSGQLVWLVERVLEHSSRRAAEQKVQGIAA